MYKYKIYGLIIDSDTEFKPLIKAGDDVAAEVFIRRGEVKLEVDDWLSEHAEGKKYDIGFEYSCFKNKGGYYVIKGGKEIFYQTSEDYTNEMIESWLLGFCLTIALLQKHILAIHCSALSCDSGAFLISGVPGAGKSTLTKALLERGYGFMADDVAGVSADAVVYPAFPYQKLCRNEVEKRELDEDDLIYINEDKDKYLVPVGETFSPEPKPLKALVFVVVGGEEVSVQQLSGLNQLMALRQNLFLHKLTGPWENDKELLELCLKVASSCKVYMISRPAGKDTVSQICDEIEKIVRN
jgi:hypothetical protein